MSTDDKIKDEKLKYDTNREAAKISALSLKKLINMNILRVKKYYLLIEFKKYNKLSLYILLYEEYWKNKQRSNLML